MVTAIAVAILSKAVSIRGANRSKPRTTASCTHYEHAYPQFILKTAEIQRGRAKQVTPIRAVLERSPIACAYLAKNGKGCDIGYAPAASSCERADSVDACTIAALDAITAFAVPDPNCSSQKQSVFSGLVALQIALKSRSLSLLRTGKVYFANPFSRRRRLSFAR
jgi:hypothetical protein